MVCKKAFLDTNIVLDIIDTNRKNHSEANELIGKLIFFGYDIFISEDMLSTIYYINKDKTATLNFFNIIQDDWNIVPFSKEIIKDAINLSLEKNLDLEDVLQCLCAKDNRCDVLITNDIKFYDCGVKIMSTKEFLDEK